MRGFQIRRQKTDWDY